jgi:isopenicillin N synthase-like dioxygenase
MIPVVDLGVGRAPDPAAPGVVDRVVAACETSGFFVVTGHGVPAASIAAVHEQARRFFALPEEEKAPTRAAERTSHLGWSTTRSEALAHSLDEVTPPDLKESYSVPHPIPWRNRRLHEADIGPPPDVWPAGVPELRPVTLDYYAHMERLAGRIMAIFALGLGLPADHFEAYIDQHISGFRLLNYPPQPDVPDVGQLRAGAHSDYGSLTILSHGDEADGLQVRQADGSWLDVPAVAGGLVVNLGDLMAQWTNDRWVSSMHRVVNPPPERRLQARQSLAFFHQPSADALIEPLPTCCSPSSPPRYGPVTSGEHLRAKLAKQRVGPPV